jgi:hypothetical protein
VNEPPDPTFLAMLRNQQFDDLENYVGRGRQLAGTPAKELERRWTALMRGWLENFTGFDHRERNDIQAELELRGIELPTRLVEDVMRSLGQLARKAADEIENFDLDRRAAIDEWLRNEVARLRPHH